jgi:molybdate transport system substrate-binding protein
MNHIRVLVLMLLSGMASVRAAEVSVAVAANFSAPMQRIASLFEQETGHKAVLSFGSTGGFYAQIRHGAPFDVFLSADEGTPAKLEHEGLGVTGSRFTYAVGRLVLWSKRAGWVDDQGEVLRTGRFERLAVANPKLAPYGAAAVEVMNRMGLMQHLSSRLVQGDNIAQTYQFVSTGNASLGFVALSQVMLEGKLSQGSAWVVPAHLYTPIRQDAVMLTKGRNTPAAQALMTFLRSGQALAVMRAHGYEN